MSNQIVLADVIQLAQVFYKSGLFRDTASEAQAIVKIMAGQEMGIPPMRAMQSINIIKGKVTLGADLMAAKIRSHPHYDYRVKKLTNDVCEIEITQDGQAIGANTFTMADAEQAGIARGDNWRNYPRNMLFARCISNAARWYCPDVFDGAVYVPEELGAEVNGETGEILEGVVVSVGSNGNGNDPGRPSGERQERQPLTRPLSPEKLVAALRKKAEIMAEKDVKELSSGKKGTIVRDLQSMLGSEALRHEFLAAVFGNESTKDLTPAQWQTLADWIDAMEMAIDDEGNTDWFPSKFAITEATNWVAANAPAAQAELELVEAAADNPDSQYSKGA